MEAVRPPLSVADTNLGAHPMTSVHTPKQVGEDELLTNLFGSWLATHGTPNQIESYNDFYEREIRPALTRRSSAGVKGLEWIEWAKHSKDCRAVTPFGVYYIEHHPNTGTGYVTFNNSRLGSFDDPKAAAQADFNTRILSALALPSHAGEDEPVAWRCKICDCHSYARVDERKPDGNFGPGPQVRCVNCKDVSELPSHAGEDEPVSWVDPKSLSALADRQRWTTVIMTNQRSENATTPLYLRPSKINGDRVEGLLDAVATMEKALELIAGSHPERVGYDQTDIDDVSDLSGDEAMKVARDALSAAMYLRPSPSVPPQGETSILRELEAACEALAATRSQETYLSMVDHDKATDALARLDRARAAARKALASQTQGEGNATWGFELHPMDTAPTGEDALEPDELSVHEGAWAIVYGTNAKPIGWIDAHATFAHRVYRSRVVTPSPTLEPSDAEVERSWPEGPFKFGDRVWKSKGSSWHGRVCGWYSTSLTPLGYNVESDREPGSVQIYPAAALIASRQQTSGERE